MKQAFNASLVVGIDCSTTAVKAIAWDPSGKPAASGRAILEIHSPRPGEFEQAAQDWWTATCTALRQVCSQVSPGRVKAIAIAHQRETFVPLDKYCRPLRPALLWMDQRGHDLLADLRDAIGGEEFHHRTGKPLSANLAPSKIEWLRRFEPQTYREAFYYVDTHAYLVHRLTGNMATSSGSADPLGLYDLTTGQWDGQILDRLGLRPENMPAVHLPGALLGRLTPAVAEETGLPPGTPVAAGLGDGQSAAFGAGVNAPGLASLSLGTSVICGCFSPVCQTSTAYRTMTGPGGTYLFETVILSGTQILDWLIRDLLGSPAPQQTYAELDAASSTIPPGSDGVMLVPYWNGVMNPYWEPSASGILVGLNAAHRPAHLYRAALEGIAYELRLHLEGLETSPQTTVKSWIASGGGARNLLWLQIIADVTGRMVDQRETTEVSALGAAMLAALAAGFYATPAEAASQMSGKTQSRITPNPETHELYTRLYSSKYRHLYPAIHEVETQSI